MRLPRQVSWVLFLARAACAGKAPPPAPPVIPARDIELSLFLIGDGGEPNEHGEPVLDWDHSGGDGWNAVRRQEAFIASHSEDGRVVL